MEMILTIVNAFPFTPTPLLVCCAPYFFVSWSWTTLLTKPQQRSNKKRVLPFRWRLTYRFPCPNGTRGIHRNGGARARPKHRARTLSLTHTLTSLSLVISSRPLPYSPGTIRLSYINAIDGCCWRLVGRVASTTRNHRATHTQPPIFNTINVYAGVVGASETGRWVSRVAKKKKFRSVLSWLFFFSFR